MIKQEEEPIPLPLKLHHPLLHCQSCKNYVENNLDEKVIKKKKKRKNKGP